MEVDPRVVGRCKSPCEATVVDVARRAQARIEAARPWWRIVREEKGIGVDRRRQGMWLLAGAQGPEEGHLGEGEQNIRIGLPGCDGTVQAGERSFRVSVKAL